jgi:hypothetical protein
MSTIEFRPSVTLTDGQANAIYTQAYYLATKGSHEQASTLFTVLRLYRPTEAKYAHAMAVCLRMLGCWASTSARRGSSAARSRCGRTTQKWQSSRPSA